MKVYIGPYVNWIGPYQIAEKLMFWANKYEDERVFAFGKWLAENKDGNPTLLNKFCSWIHSKKNRKIKVKIDGYDTWSLDETLCHVIHPLLVEFRKYPGGLQLQIWRIFPEICMIHMMGIIILSKPICGLLMK